MDLSLFLGALGVVLTVVFFVIGYRQTIGARRERARAANKALVDTMFRRLALEEEFSLSRSAVTKIISGWAVNARVRSTDIHSLQEVEELLLARVLESDYISQAQRRTIASRISQILKEEYDPLYLGKRALESSRTGVEWLLGLGSALAAAVSAGVAAQLIGDAADDATMTLVESAILPAFALIILTTGALLLYTRARDLSRLGAETLYASPSLEMGLERSVYLQGRRRNRSVRPSIIPEFDFTYEEDGKLVGVEVKRNINKTSGAALRRLVSRLRSSVAQGRVSRAIIVCGSRPMERVRKMADEQVNILHVAEFLSNLPLTRPAGDAS